MLLQLYQLKRKIVEKPKIVFTGLQKGEKIYEELILGKNLKKTKIKDILEANEKINDKVNYLVLLAKLKKSYIQNNNKKLLYYLTKYA